MLAIASAWHSLAASRQISAPPSPTREKRRLLEVGIGIRPGREPTTLALAGAFSCGKEQLSRIRLHFVRNSGGRPTRQGALVATPRTNSDPAVMIPQYRANPIRSSRPSRPRSPTRRFVIRRASSFHSPSELPPRDSCLPALRCTILPASPCVTSEPEPASDASRSMSAWIFGWLVLWLPSLTRQFCA